MTRPRKPQQVLASTLAALTVVDNNIARLSTKARKVDGYPPLKASVWQEEPQLKDFMKEERQVVYDRAKEGAAGSYTLAVLTVVDNDLAELSTKARKVDGAGVPPLKASVWREEIQLKD